MKTVKNLTILMLLIVGFCAAFAQNNKDEQAIRDLFKPLPEIWANKDVDAMSKLFAESHSIVFPNGHSVLNNDRETFKAMHGQFLNSPEMATSKIQFEIKNIHQVSNKLAIVHLYFKEIGGGPDGDDMETAVLEKTAEGWKILALHITPVIPMTEGGK